HAVEPAQKHRQQPRWGEGGSPSSPSSYGRRKPGGRVLFIDNSMNQTGSGALAPPGPVPPFRGPALARPAPVMFRRPPEAPSARTLDSRTLCMHHVCMRAVWDPDKAEANLEKH